MLLPTPAPAPLPPTEAAVLLVLLPSVGTAQPVRAATAAELHALLAIATPAELVLFAPQPRVRPELLALLLDFVAHHELKATG